MCKTLSFHLFNIRRIRKYLSKDSTRTESPCIYAFMICCMVYQPHISKCCNVFRLSAAQLVCSLPRFCHITPTLLPCIGCPALCFRIEFKLLILAFKAHHGLQHLYITDLINVKQQFGRMMLRSQPELQLLPPRTITKKTLGDRSFMASAPKLWEQIAIKSKSSK